MSFIAGQAYVLVNRDDYTPGEGVIPLESSWIMNIHITGALNSPVTIETHLGTSIVFPKGALQQGAIYPYSVKTITLDSSDAGKVLGLAPGYKVALF